MIGRRSWGTGVRLSAAALGITAGLLVAPVAGADPLTPVEPEQTTAVAVSATVEQEGVAHLPSPDNLPPGTTSTAPERRTLGYLREIWNAVRTEDVTMGDAILLLAQRPLSSVPAGMSAQPPLADPADPAVPPPPAP